MCCSASLGRRSGSEVEFDAIRGQAAGDRRRRAEGQGCRPAPHIDRHIVTADELAGLANALGPDHGPMAYLGAGLRVGRLDFLRSTITVAEQISRGAHGQPVSGPPKSDAGRRTLAAPEPLMAMLAEILARRGLTGADVDAYVFASPDGEPLEYSNFRYRHWLPACDVAGLWGLQSMTSAERTPLGSSRRAST